MCLLNKYVFFLSFSLFISHRVTQWKFICFVQKAEICARRRQPLSSINTSFTQFLQYNTIYYDKLIKKTDDIVPLKIKKKVSCVFYYILYLSTVTLCLCVCVFVFEEEQIVYIQISAHQRRSELIFVFI